MLASVFAFMDIQRDQLALPITSLFFFSFFVNNTTQLKMIVVSVSLWKLPDMINLSKS